MHKKTLIRLTAALSVIVVAAAVIYGAVVTAEPPPAAWAPSAVKVALAPVQRRTVPQVFSGIGELEAGRQVQVAAEVGGRVTRVAFESGLTVEAGQLLVQLNDAPEQAELIRLQAQLRNAETLYARARKLVAANAATQEQLDNALAARDMALGELRQTQAIIAQKSIRAPFDGVLGIRRVHAGQYLNPADAVASLIDSESLYVNFSLDEQSSPWLAVGLPVEVLVDAYPGQSFVAEISAVDPLIAQSRMIQVQATLANPGQALKAGMYANVRVGRQDTAPVLTVPETAVTYTAYGDTVFVAQPGDKQALTVQRVLVKVGARIEGRVVIESGLSDGELVVTSGQLKLSDGMAVQAAGQDTLAIPPRAALVSDS